MLSLSRSLLVLCLLDVFCSVDVPMMDGRKAFRVYKRKGIEILQNEIDLFLDHILNIKSKVPKEETCFFDILGKTSLAIKKLFVDSVNMDSEEEIANDMEKKLYIVENNIKVFFNQSVPSLIEMIGNEIRLFIEVLNKRIPDSTIVYYIAKMIGNRIYKILF